MSEQTENIGVEIVVQGVGWINRADGTKEPIQVTSEPVLVDLLEVLKLKEGKE